MAVRAEQRSYQGHAVPTVDQRLRPLFAGLLTITAVIAFAIAIMASIVVGYGLYYQDEVYPGVQAVGVDIGGVTPEAAEATLDQKTDAYLSNDLTFVHENQTFTADPTALGIEFDNARSVENAYDFGRSGNWWMDSWDWLDSLLFGHDVGVYATADPAAFEAYLSSISGDVAVRAQTPEFRLNENRELQLTAASEGVGIDVATTLRDLRAQLTKLGTDPVQISTASVAPVYDESLLEPLHERMSAILSEPFVMEQSGYRWAFDVGLVRSLLSVNVDAERGEATLSLDTDRLERHISAFAENAHQEGHDARVRWDGEQFAALPSTDGWVIDVEPSVTAAEQAILDGEHHLELATSARPAALTTDDAEAAADFGNQLVDSRFGLTWDDGETDIAGSVIAATLSFTADPKAGEFVPQIHEDELALYLTSISNSVEVEPVNADLRYVNGEVTVVNEEEPGQRMDRALSAEAIAEAVRAGESSAEIVVEDAEPDVTAAMANEIEIREMISFGETYYSNSAANRAHNVELATQRASGAMVPPGGEYSFVDTIGEITVESGYELGFGIIGATDGGVTTVPSVGGGVCQVSTTIFQAAFWAGMPIVERNWHLYWLPLYGQDPTGITGLDATVDTSAGLDFKFTNTTDDWIAIVATADGNAVRFEIWGTDPNWEVETDGPHVTNRVTADTEMQYEETDRLPAGTETHVETATDGFDVLIERRVFDSEGELIDELELESRYRPASNRTLVGTGD